MHMNECKVHRNHDTYICQKCGHIFCSGCNDPEWRTDITENKHAGNVCQQCVKFHNVSMKIKKDGCCNSNDLIECFTQPVGAQRR